jgi:hypothetical protein
MRPLLLFCRYKRSAICSRPYHSDKNVEDKHVKIEPSRREIEKRALPQRRNAAIMQEAASGVRHECAWGR